MSLLENGDDENEEEKENEKSNPTSHSDTDTGPESDPEDSGDSGDSDDSDDSDDSEEDVPLFVQKGKKRVRKGKKVKVKAKRTVSQIADDKRERELAKKFSLERKRALRKQKSCQQTAATPARLSLVTLSIFDVDEPSKCIELISSSLLPTLLRWTIGVKRSDIYNMKWFYDISNRSYHASGTKAQRTIRSMLKNTACNAEILAILEEKHPAFVERAKRKYAKKREPRARLVTNLKLLLYFYMADLKREIYYRRGRAKVPQKLKVVNVTKSEQVLHENLRFTNGDLSLTDGGALNLERGGGADSWWNEEARVCTVCGVACMKTTQILVDKSSPNLAKIIQSFILCDFSFDTNPCEFIEVSDVVNFLREGEFPIPPTVK